VSRWAGGRRRTLRRAVEFWCSCRNIRGEGGDKDGFPVIGELPHKNIDTGWAWTGSR